MSKKYNRYFLIFNEEDKGFEAASDKQPTGYTKIETKSGKCKITVYAQNLNVNKGPYACYLVDSSKSTAKVAKLGELLVDDSGKGETVWEHDAKNISGTGLSSDKFNVAAVVKEGNRLQVPLAGYSGKDKILWRDKINSRSFTEEVEEIKEVKEHKESKVSKKKKSKHGESKKDDELREPLEEEVDSTDKDIKDQISEIVEQAESEVLEENRDIVEETRTVLANEEDDYDIGEESSIEELIFKDSIDIKYDENLGSIDFDDYDKQLQRDDAEYIEAYSEEGRAFSHYEQEINLQNADINYAIIETLDEEHRDVDIPEVKKMNVFNDESFSDEPLEEYLCDARDIVAQSIEFEPSILHRAIDSINLDRNKLCHDLKVDLEKLNKQVEKEVKKVLERELEKYKKSVLKHVCKSEHNHCENHKKNEHKCEDKHHKMKHDHDCKDYDDHHGHHGHHHEHCHGKKEYKCGEDKKHNKKKGYARILHGILSSHEKVEVKGAKDCRFWKVSEHDKFPNKDNAMQPYYSAVHHLKMTYPYINYVKYFKIKGHYYFGMKYDKDSEVKYLIYGIEGDKKESHQPYKGMTGFVSWVPHGNSGIWLMYYNPYTGCVMLPKAKGDKKR